MDREVYGRKSSLRVSVRMYEFDWIDVKNKKKIYRGSAGENLTLGSADFE
jgi:hypothetical protein